MIAAASLLHAPIGVDHALVGAGGTLAFPAHFNRKGSLDPESFPAYYPVCSKKPKGVVITKNSAKVSKLFFVAAASP